MVFITISMFPCREILFVLKYPLTRSFKVATKSRLVPANFNDADLTMVINRLIERMFNNRQSIRYAAINIRQLSLLFIITE